MSFRKVVKMEIYYNSVGVPFIIKEGVIYEFSSIYARNIIAELALDVELFNNVKNNVIDRLKSIAESINLISSTNNVASIQSQIDELFYIGQFNSVLNVLADAEDIQYQIVNPQPYNSWGWDRLNKTWVPPIEKPINVPDENMVWDESSMSWSPTIPSPHDQWFWSWETQSWHPPIAYPVNAEENEFVWSDELSTWILNDQVS